MNDNFDLSILVPSRNEMFLKRTVEDILEHSGERTEIIVALEGDWPQEPIPTHPRVSMLYNPEPQGQRHCTNQAAALSSAKYVLKCDAHVAWAPGFDEVLLNAIDGHDDWTLVPKMYNLHAYDWVCTGCDKRTYQGPTPGVPQESHGQRIDSTGICDVCGEIVVKDVKWRTKSSPESTAMRFDRDLHFQYWGEYKDRQQWEGGCAETMSILGAVWMLSRERYWELNICDEAHGSWGQQGTEVACKTWLSGGRLMCCRDTHFAHMFRTQGGDFSFPYPQSGRQVDEARSYSRKLWFGNSWDKAVRPLSWMIDHFNPPDWEDYVTTKKKIVYYTHHKTPLKVSKNVQTQIKRSGLPIVSVSLKPMEHFGQNIRLSEKPGVLTMFKQILAGLEAATADVIFFCEHDVLYHPSHFEFLPPRDDKFFYNVNVWKVRQEDGFSVKVDDCRQTSGLCANRDLLLEHYRKRVEMVERDGFSRSMGFEPGTHGRAERVDDYKSDIWTSAYPNLDIRTSTTLTASRWSPDQFRSQRYTRGWTEAHVFDIPGWPNLAQFGLFTSL